MPPWIGVVFLLQGLALLKASDLPVFKVTKCCPKEEVLRVMESKPKCIKLAGKKIQILKYFLFVPSSWSWHWEDPRTYWRRWNTSSAQDRSQYHTSYLFWDVPQSLQGWRDATMWEYRTSRNQNKYKSPLIHLFGTVLCFLRNTAWGHQYDDGW